MSWNLIQGHENVRVDIYRPSHVENNYGAETETFVLLTSDVVCRVDSARSPLRREVQGAQAKTTHTMFVDRLVDVRNGDKITNIREITPHSDPNMVTINNTVQIVRQNEFLVTNVINPGWEFSHLEVDLYEITGQHLT